MISRVLNCTPSFLNPFRYNENKVMQGVADLVAVRNIHGDDYWSVRNALAAREAMALATTKPSVHMTFNASDSDVVRDANEMLDIIDQTMKDIGMADQPYVIYRHHDIERDHFHVVSTKVGPTGQSVLWNGIGKRATHSLELHQGEHIYTAGKSIIEDLKKREASVRKVSTFKQIKGALDKIVTEGHFSSRKEYSELLRAVNLSVKFVDGEKTNEGSRAVVHRCEEGQIVGRPLFLNAAEVAMIDKVSRKEKEVDKNKGRGFRGDRGAIIIAYLKSNSMEEFIQKCESRNIIASVYRKEDGTPYGVSFASLCTLATLKASDVLTFKRGSAEAKLHGERPLSKALLNCDFTNETKTSVRKEAIETGLICVKSRESKSMKETPPLTTKKEVELEMKAMLSDIGFTGDIKFSHGTGPGGNLTIVKCGNVYVDVDLDGSVHYTKGGWRYEYKDQHGECVHMKDAARFHELYKRETLFLIPRVRRPANAAPGHVDNVEYCGKKDEDEIMEEIRLKLR